uniref:MCP four helix bundle domain-containing protein n=1 Tax=Geobacter sp. TaxID=46610 RepID=UPI002627725B
MQWYYNLRIATKLLTGFIAVAAIAGIIGGVGIVKIKAIEEADTAMYELNTRPMAPILDMAVAYQRIRNNYRDLALDRTAEERNKHATRIKELEKTIGDALPEVEKSLKSEETKKAFAEIKANFDRFKPALERIVSLTMAGKNDEAVAYMRSEGANGPATLAKEVDDSIQKLSDLKIAQAKQRSVENIATSKAAVTLTTILLCVGVLLAVGLGVFISRIISRPLREAVDVSNHLAEGDLTVSIEAKSKDETGQLLTAMQNMVDKLKVVVADVKSAADNVASGSQELSSSSEEMSQGATEQAAAAEEASSSMEQMSSNI